MENEEQDYDVILTCTFAATSPKDAVDQMITFVADYGPTSGYRVVNLDTGESVFIDAEKVVWGER